MSNRLVVVLFGPPGAGKTTIARESGLQIFDRDDPQWRGQGETGFRAAISRLAENPDAQAVAIRSGATSGARRRTIGSVNATHAYLVLADPLECHYRVGHRRRADMQASQAGIDKWFRSFDQADQLHEWPGNWDTVRETPPMRFIPVPRDCMPKVSTAGDPRGTRAWRRLRERVYAEETHCWKCGKWVDQSLPSTEPMSRTADHLDAIARGHAAVPDRSRVRLCHRRCNGRRGAKRERTSLSVSLDSI